MEASLLALAKSIIIIWKFISGIPTGSKPINALSRQWWYHFYPHIWDIIFDQSAYSIFARCQALVISLRLVFSEFSRVEVKF